MFFVTGTSYGFILQVAWASTGMLSYTISVGTLQLALRNHDRQLSAWNRYFSFFAETEDVQPFVCLESEKLTYLDASKLINERE